MVAVFRYLGRISLPALSHYVNPGAVMKKRTVGIWAGVGVAENRRYDSCVVQAFKWRMATPELIQNHAERVDVNLVRKGILVVPAPLYFDSCI